MTVLLGILFVVAAGIAYAFYLQYDALKKKDDERRLAAETASASGQKAQKELDQAREELTRKKAEAAELREKLNDLRSRQHKQRESDQKRKAGAEVELADQLADARRALEEETGRADVLARESKGMQEEVTRLREGQKRLEEALKAAQAAAQRAAAAPAPAAAAPVALAPPQKTDSELQARVASLESQLREARRKADAAEDEKRKAAGKASASSRQLLLNKNELDLFREKLVWSEKRVVELERLLFTNKIALPEREIAPQPRAPRLAPGLLKDEGTTNAEGVVAEAADYVPEAAATTDMPTAATVPAADSGVAAPEVAEAASTEAAPGVPPMRRTKAEVAARTEGEAKAE